MAVLLSIALVFNLGCESVSKSLKGSAEPTNTTSRQPLSLLSINQDGAAKDEENMMDEFGRRHSVPVEYIPSGGDSITRQLELTQEIFRHHYSHPDILMIDTEWPALLANDLVDLKPYLGDTLQAFAPVEILNNTVNGRVVGLPIIIDFSVLYYRPTLLARYGFRHPPENWDEMERMALIIQNGERRRGNRDFWGYGWAGGDNEALTCHALEWFLSNSGSNFVEQDGSVRLNTPQNVAALKRAASWIGLISPPGVPVYHESDVENLWRAGQTAFIGGWINMSKVDEKPVGGDLLPFEIAAVPAGSKGHFGVLGDMSLGISKYAANRDLALKALKEFASDTVQRDRLRKFGIIPTRLSLFREPETFRLTLLRNAAAQRSLSTLAARPSTVLGTRYDGVSRDITASLNSVLLGHQTAEAALAGLQVRTEKMVQGIATSQQ